MGAAAWRTLTSVRFAVLQIILLAIAGLIGTLVRQIPSFALRDPAAYAEEIAALHQRYDSLAILGVNVGPTVVDAFERLGFFRVFSAPWFTLMLTLLVVSIVVCTLDRTPRLWRGVRDVRVAQPQAFFDPRLPQRSEYAVADLKPTDLTAILRRRRFKVRQATESTESSGPVVFVYGDRNQYFKMATLLTHLGLILFLAGGAVTGALGYETVLFVGEGQTAPVQPVGTPHNLLVKNHGFEAPQRADGSFVDYRTDLAVYQDGREIARRTIRVNEPLSVANFTFHQNTFGPAVDLDILDAAGRLVWTGPVLLEGSALGLPQGFLTIPGSQLGVITLLDRDASGAPILKLLGLGAGSDGSTHPVFADAVGLGAATSPTITAGYTIRWSETGAFSGMVVKSDPGQGLIWLAYASLISGLALSFYFPRRRVWARFEGGRLRLAMLADRYVDAEREFERLTSAVTAAASGALPPGARTGRA